VFLVFSTRSGQFASSRCAVLSANMTEGWGDRLRDAYDEIAVFPSTGPYTLIATCAAHADEFLQSEDETGVLWAASGRVDRDLQPRRNARRVTAVGARAVAAAASGDRH
jgi:hypothetical protein